MSWKFPDRIPPLSGWFLKLYRIVFALCPMTAVYSLFAVYIPDARRIPQVMRGIYSTGLTPTSFAQDEVAFAPMVPSAADKGFRSGDVVLSVDGQRLEGSFPD